MGDKLAQHINIVLAHQAFDKQQAQSHLDGKVEGIYDNNKHSITLIADNLTPQRAQWVAWHELGHRGFNTPHFREWQALVTKARTNPSVNKIASAIMRERQQYQNDSAGHNIDIATEEALVEIFAAIKTKDFAQLQNRYNLNIPTTMQRGFTSFATRLLNQLKALIAKITSRNANTLSDSDILSILRKVEMAAADTKAEANSTQAKFSLYENDHSPFKNAIDSILAGKTPPHFINMGKTPAVLKMLGLPDTKVRIKGATIEKVMGQYLGIEQGEHSNLHNLTPNTLRQIPQQINNPVAVFESGKDATRQGYVVLTELTEKDAKTGKNKPVIAALHLNRTRQGVELIDIASIYGRSNNQLQQAINNDLLYWNKTKGQQFLAAVGLQLPMALRTGADLSKSNIKTNTDLAQYINANKNKSLQKTTDNSYNVREQRAIAQGFMTEQQWEDLIHGAAIQRSVQGRVVQENETSRNGRRDGSTGIRDGGLDRRIRTFYHGTRDNIDAFDLNHPNRKDHGWLGTGVYLTDSPDLAAAYAVNKKGSGGNGQNIMPLSARLQNPFIANKQVKERLRKLDRQAADAFTQQLKDKGYDGVILQIAPDGYEIVVFNPANVRSVFAEFNPEKTNDNGLLLSRGQNRAPTPDNLNRQMGNAIRAIAYNNHAPSFIARQYERGKQKFNQGKQKVFNSKSVGKVKDRWTDNLKITLQALGRRQIVDIYAKILPQLKSYSDLVDRFSADSNMATINADKLVTQWGKLKKADGDKLAELMHDATLQQIDADPNTEAATDADPKQVKILRARFRTLPKEAQDIYRRARDDYKEHYSNVHTAMRERLLRLGADNKTITALDTRALPAIKGVIKPSIFPAV